MQAHMCMVSDGKAFSQFLRTISTCEVVSTDNFERFKTKCDSSGLKDKRFSSFCLSVLQPAFTARLFDSGDA